MWKEAIFDPRGRLSTRECCWINSQLIRVKAKKREREGDTRTIRYDDMSFPADDAVNAAAINSIITLR